jgi:hypothetical protein
MRLVVGDLHLVSHSPCKTIWRIARALRIKVSYGALKLPVAVARLKMRELLPAFAAVARFRAPTSNFAAR